MNLRERALDILERIDRTGAYATLAMSGLDELDARDANFVRTLVFGVLRWRLQLDWTIERLANRKVGRVDRLVLQILRIGVYQLIYMDVPSHAAVAETMEVAARRTARAKGFVNGVLRQAAREDLRSFTAQDDAIRTSHPRWLFDRWVAQYGMNQATRIAEADQELSYPDLLVNTTRVSMDYAAALLRERGVVHSQSALLPNVVRLAQSTAAVANEIEAGIFYPMDEGSAVIASLVGGPRALDMTAAPGGKTIAMMLRGIDVVSADMSIARLWLLRESAPRMFGRGAKIVVADGESPPFRGRFDTVLLDAPCSATGTIRKNPELKWRVTPEAIASAAVLQRRLLAAALDIAERECIYSTCSLEPEENEEVVRATLSTRSDFELADLAASAPEGVLPWILAGSLRLTPDSGADGFTAFRILRKS